MPSQISLRTSPVLSKDRAGHKGLSAGYSRDRETAAGSVDSLLGNHRKPHMATIINGSCGSAEPKAVPKCISTAMTNGNGAVYLNSRVNDCLNGTLDTPLLSAEKIHSGVDCCKLPPMSVGQHSNKQSSLTGVSNEGRLMCPELADSYINTMIGKRAGSLASKQRGLEQKIISLQQKIRLRQLHMVHSHACRQLHYDSCTDQDSTNMGEESNMEGSGSSLTESEFSMEISPPRTGGHTGAMDLPIQVDGASDDTFAPLPAEMMEGGVPRRKHNEDSFCSLESCASSSSPDEAGGNGGADALMAQLASLETLLDADLTEVSSDDEEDEETDLQYRHDLRSFWSHTRSALGSRWVWLQRRIAELNKQIYRLDHHVKESCSQDKFIFSLAPATTAVSAATVLPQYVSVANGSVLEHFHTTNGGASPGGLITMNHKTGGTNGFHYPHGQAQCLPHLLLPEGLLNAKLQVKDLLSPSPGNKGMLFVNEGNSSAARTRPLLRRVTRRVVHKKGRSRGRGLPHLADMAFHPHLSMAHELPSRIPLDCALKNVLAEHSYAQLPPLSKRRRGVVQALPPLTTTTLPSHDYTRSRSASPSPVHTPLSLDSSRDGSARKRPAPFQYQVSLDSSGGGSPWSPGISRPSTPSFTPSMSTRKKRFINSTPLFDIDNIVIPYSVASSTRLEKLEYKEIITPSWREVVQERPPSAQGQTASVLEDCSDEAFTTRHGRCELIEKKRFLNFISGAQRKRGRPQSMTLDSPALTSPPPPPPRRVTVASPSPSCAEVELATCIHTVVLPWQPREFPLDEAEQKALVTPPPPPPILTRPPSPAPFCTSTPSKTPSCTSSGLVTPLGSPHSAGNGETPAISPVEWIVDPHSASELCNHRTIGTADAALPSSSQNPIILKLTKKV